MMFLIRTVLGRGFELVRAALIRESSIARTRELGALHMKATNESSDQLRALKSAFCDETRAPRRSTVESSCTSANIRKCCQLSAGSDISA